MTGRLGDDYIMNSFACASQSSFSLNNYAPLRIEILVITSARTPSHVLGITSIEVSRLRSRAINICSVSAHGHDGVRCCNDHELRPRLLRQLYGCSLDMHFAD
jgi:hypothetical protein